VLVDSGQYKVTEFINFVKRLILTHHSQGYILASQPNFRDLGGIPTKDGTRIRPGLIFRSGDLSMLDAEDISVLEKLNLKTIADFRSDREIAKRPDREIHTVRHSLHFPIEDAARELAMRLFDEKNAEGLKQLLVDDYRRMIREHTDAFKGFFECLQDPAYYPLVFHCAAGKDRTGMAAWFLLSALGAPEEIIREDYLATNIYSKSFADKIVAKTSEQGMHGEIIRPLLEVRNEYIGAALEVIEKEYGGMEKFLKEELQIERSRLDFLTS
jgi:protein-tyrosine phosphatase